MPGRARVAVRSPRRALRRAREELRGMWWATRAVRALRRDLDDQGLQASVARPPDLDGSSAARVELALRVARATCLERAMVMQRWLLEHGVERAVVIGVNSAEEEFGAHAWLDGEDDGGHLELRRLKASS